MGFPRTIIALVAAFVGIQPVSADSPARFDKERMDASFAAVMEGVPDPMRAALLEAIVTVAIGESDGGDPCDELAHLAHLLATALPLLGSDEKGSAHVANAIHGMSADEVIAKAARIERRNESCWGSGSDGGDSTVEP